MTKFEERFYNDIHRIADSIEKIAKVVVTKNEEEERSKSDLRELMEKIFNDITGDENNGYIKEFNKDDK